MTEAEARVAAGTEPLNSLVDPKRPLPAPDSDFYMIHQVLSEDEQALLRKVRSCMEEAAAPAIDRHEVEDDFLFELIPAIRELNIAGVGFEGYGCPGGRTLLEGFVAMELARIDSSIATFYGVHSGLAMGSIYFGGSEEQRQKWLPPMARLEKVGCFGLTEPLVGTDAGDGFLTTAERENDTWILNGRKRWIGNASWCDLSIIWARDVDDNQIKGFIVENGMTPGFIVERIESKITLRAVQNGLITLDNCRVPEENRLQGDMSFHDAARVLRLTRQYISWEAVGCSMGAYEHALRYAQACEQFGRPIASFQMIQDLLARMLGNITASQCMVVRLAQLQDEGKMLDQHASLAKTFCTHRMRETIVWARELFGGNGIVLDDNVARFFADAEALYSYEGAREMNSIMVDQALPEFSAFA